MANNAGSAEDTLAGAIRVGGIVAAVLTFLLFCVLLTGYTEELLINNFGSAPSLLFLLIGLTVGVAPIIYVGHEVSAGLRDFLIPLYLIALGSRIQSQQIGASMPGWVGELLFWYGIVAGVVIGIVWVVALIGGVLLSVFALNIDAGVTSAKYMYHEGIGVALRPVWKLSGTTRSVMFVISAVAAVGTLAGLITLDPSTIRPIREGTALFVYILVIQLSLASWSASKHERTLVEETEFEENVKTATKNYHRTRQAPRKARLKLRSAGSRLKVLLTSAARAPIRLGNRMRSAAGTLVDRAVISPFNRIATVTTGARAVGCRMVRRTLRGLTFPIRLLRRLTGALKEKLHRVKSSIPAIGRR